MAAAVFLLPIANPDLWWHLSAARYIIEHRAFPREEWLSHTMAGVPWADFEWGVQLLWYGLKAAGGMTALWALKAGLLAATAAIVWRTLALYGVAGEGGAFGAFAWALSTMMGNDLRPENFSLLFFASLLFWIERRRLRTPEAAGSAIALRTIAGCAAFFCVWANLHAGFFYGFVLLGAYAAADFVRRKDRTLAAALGASAASSLINPYGAEVYWVAVQHAAQRKTLQAFIREWGAPDLFEPSLAPFWLILAVSFAVVLRGQLTRRSAPAEHIALLLVFAISSAAHVRTGVYFLTVAIVILAAAWVRIDFPPGIGRMLRIGGTFAGTVFFFRVIFPAFDSGAVFRPHYVPMRAAAFLEREASVLAGKPLYNPWEWGGYLGYTLYPRYRIFNDGRYPFHSMLPGVNEAKQSPDRYHAYMLGHGVEIALVQRVGQFLRAPIVLKDGREQLLMRPFYLFFLPSEYWALIYWDPQAMVFVRRGTVPDAWLKGMEFKWFRPDDLAAASLSLHEGVVGISVLEAEVARFIADGAAADEVEAAREWLRGLREFSS